MSIRSSSFEEAAHLDPGLVQTCLDVRVELRELERDRVAVGVLADERDVDDADRARLDELREGRRDLALESVAGERR